MKQPDLENYIAALLATAGVDKEILAEIPNSKLLLKVYELGLEGKEFDPMLLLENLDLEKDIPAPWHVAVATMAIIKSKKGSAVATKYLLQNTERMLEEFRNYFIKQPPTHN